MSVMYVSWLPCVIALSISIPDPLPAHEFKFSFSVALDCEETSVLAPDAELKVIP